MEAKLPRMGSRVRSAHGEGVVVDRQILTQLVQIRTDENRRITVVIEDIVERDVPAASREPARDTAPPATQEPDASAQSGRRRRRRGRRHPAKDAGDPADASPPSATTDAEPTRDGGENAGPANNA